MRKIFQVKIEEYRPGKFPCAVVELRKNVYLFGIKISSKKFVNKKGSCYEIEKGNSS